MRPTKEPPAVAPPSPFQLASKSRVSLDIPDAVGLEISETRGAAPAGSWVASQALELLRSTESSRLVRTTCPDRDLGFLDLGHVPSSTGCRARPPRARALDIGVGLPSEFLAHRDAGGSVGSAFPAAQTR